MRLLDQILQTARQAQASGAATVPGPAFPLGPGADPRWRPTPDPIDGALRFDPEFSLPTLAGPLTWRLFYDSASANASLDGEYGIGRSASFPLRLVRDAVIDRVTVMHEDGGIRRYDLTGGLYVANPPSGDSLTFVNSTWKETLGANGLEYYFPAGDFSTLSYRATPQGQRLTYNYTYASGKLQTASVQDPAGRRVTLTCNGDGRVQTVEDWGQRGLVVLTYGAAGDLTELWEQEGVVTSYGYDVGGNHLVTSILDPAGFVTSYTYTPVTHQVWTRSVNGHLSQYDYGTPGETGYIDPLGRRWTHLTDAQGYPTGRMDPLGHQEVYTYVNGQPMEFANALGQSVSFAYDANGYLQVIRDELGYRTTFMRDASGNILSVINALGNITTLTYSSPASLRQLEAIIDANGNRTTFAYYSTGLPQYILDAAGYRTTFVWTNEGVLASVVNARGFVWTYSYNAVGNRIETLDSLRNRWTYIYDQRGRLIGEQTPLGDRWTTVYDARDMVQAEIDPLSNRWTYTWTAEGDPAEVIDAAGHRWTSLYDDADQQYVTIDPLGNRTSFGYDLAGRLITVQDALGKMITLGYDATNRLTVTIDQLGYHSSYIYDAAGRVLAIQNARGYLTTYSYDPIGQLRSMSNALGYIVTIDYDAIGQPTVMYDPLGNRTTLQYDSRGSLHVWINPAGKQTTYSYNPTGRLESRIDPRGKRWTNIFDEWDRLQASVNPLDKRVTLIYDPAGRVSALWDPRGNRWSTVYDARDLGVATIDPLGRRATFAYDSLGQLVTWTDQKAQLVTYTYSNRYELTQEQYADGTRMTYSHDAVGQLRTVVDAIGTYTLTYDDRGELTTVQAPQHPSSGIITYGYDAVGNRILISSWLGRQTMMYDALDRCASMIYDSSKITTWLYDGLNRPTMQFNWNGTRTTWGYDPSGLVSLVRHSTSGAVLLEYAAYTYDDASNPLTRITNGNKITTWTYDDATQLLTEWHSGGTVDTFTWDEAGNRTVRSRSTGGAPSLTTAVYDAVGQLVTMLAGTSRTTFVYDLNGNLQSENTSPAGITTYSWDALNRLSVEIVSGGGRTTYTYRYDDLRSSQNPGSGVQTLVWDALGANGSGDLFEELDSSNNLLRAYFRGTDLATQKDTSGSYAFHWMDMGTAQILTDLNQAQQASYQFSAWGELFSSTGPANTPLSWNGEWGYHRDTSARTWVRQRHLDVLRGRWFSQDPIDFQAGLNLYQYVGNNPIFRADPEGLIRIEISIGANGLGTGRVYADPGDVVPLGVLYPDLSESPLADFPMIAIGSPLIMTFPVGNIVTSPGNSPSQIADPKRKGTGNGPFPASPRDRKGKPIPYPITRVEPVHNQKIKKPKEPWRKDSFGPYKIELGGGVPALRGTWIHGGRAAQGGYAYRTHGCIRVDNIVLLDLAELLRYNWLPGHRNRVIVDVAPRTRKSQISQEGALKGREPQDMIPNDFPNPISLRPIKPRPKKNKK